MELPTQEELSQLPRRAIVAYAARCARRVLPIYLATEPPEQHRSAVAHAVEMAERAACDAVDITDAKAAYNAAKRVAMDSDTTHAAITSATSAALTAFSALAGRTAYAARVAEAAHSAAEAADAAFSDAAALADAHDVGGTINAASAAARAADAIRDDFEALRRLATEESWTDDTPVPLDRLPAIAAE